MIEIRNPRPDEYHQLAEMVAAFLLELRALRPLKTGEALVALRGLLAHPERGEILVATEDDQILGVATLSYQWAIRTRGLYAILQEMYVVSHARSRGVGGRLLEVACGVAAEAGCLQLELATPGDDSPHRGLRAEQFYLAHQFHRVGKRLVKAL